MSSHALLLPEPIRNALSAMQMMLPAHAVRLVGGTVRNLIMEIPAGDLDMASTARPEDVLQAAEKAGYKAIPTGIQHGTITVIYDSIPIEITTLRSDTACDGRHATVAYTDDWQADAMRRDFTHECIIL